MGLDNGITLTTRHKIDFDNWDEKPDYVIFPFEETARENGVYEYDICYWRKCWDVRHAILNILNASVEGGRDYDIDTPAQIVQIQDALIHFLEEPEEWTDSIWTINEIAGTLAQQIINLTWLHRYMEKHKNERIKVIFYDSY